VSTRGLLKELKAISGSSDEGGPRSVSGPVQSRWKVALADRQRRDGPSLRRCSHGSRCLHREWV